jgi:hypothetical protein
MKSNKALSLAGILLLVLLISGFTRFNSMNRWDFSSASLQEPESYKELWEKVDSLMNTGMPQSALALTDSIYSLARQSENQPQTVRAILYRIRLKGEYQEDFIVGSIDEIKEALNDSESSTTQLLHSILADLYWRYYQVNRMVFFERTQVMGPDPEDLLTWDLSTLTDRVIYHYSASLENEEILKNTPIDYFNAILDTATGSRKFRPTLYDFLAHRALDFYINDESSLTQPAERFELNRADDFSEALLFSRRSYETRDSLSLKFHAVMILQNLIAFHYGDEDPTALVDANLKRLDFVHRNSIHPEKDSLYYQALKDFEVQTITHPASTQVSYTIGRYLEQQSRKYNPAVSEKHRWDAKYALEKCMEAVERFPQSQGAEKCKSLINQISKKNFRITVEQETLPGSPFLGLLKFKNLSDVHFRIIEMDYEEHKSMLRGIRKKEDLIAAYLKREPVLSWSQTLPETGDYLEHAAEIEIPALEPGFYVLMGAGDPDFKADTAGVTHQEFWATRMGYISLNNEQGGYDLYVLDRASGSALQDVEATLVYREYDYQTRSYTYRNGGNFRSDDSGYFSIPPLSSGKKANSFFLKFKKGDDQLVTGDRYYHGRGPTGMERTRTKTHLFTDRAIYRPGQTIYFKGIVLEKKGENASIKTDFKTSVELLDVNRQKISELEFKTNDYGSFQGAFILPSGVLNGRMTLKTPHGRVTVLVEEYKRPNFQVQFLPVKGSYRLNEELNVEGSATAYAGNAIGGAKVSFRVVRETYFPWRFDYFRPMPQQTSMEITNGTTETDAEGKFNVRFNAIGDNNFEGPFDQAFSYTIFADVTDINNETQSNSTVVRVGSKALTVDLGVGDAENRKSFSSFTLQTTNLNGYPVSSEGTITISTLKEPGRLFRERLWQTPDLSVIDQKTFEKQFPHDVFMNENDPSKLEVEKIHLERQFQSTEDSVITLENIQSWKTGRYKITVQTTDEFGSEVKEVRYFILYSPDEKSAPMEEINWFHVLKNECEPGESAQFLIGTADRDVRVLYEVVQKEAVLYSEWIELNKNQKTIQIPVDESMRGGFKVNLVFVKHNRVYKNNFGVEVPHTDKKLDFEFVTFRDKLQPGDEEEWRIEIKGHAGEKVAAELLAGMFDQSLEKFTPHNWFMRVFTNPYHGRNWNTNNAFHNTSSSHYYTELYDPVIPVFQEYDQLNWFGFNYYGGYLYRGGRQTDVLYMQQVPEGKAMVMEESLTDTEGQPATNGDPGGEEPDEPDPSVQPTTQATDTQAIVRRDFRETAFFFPMLKTDEEGTVVISFTVPESLTQWKLMGLAHTKDLKTGQFIKEITTRKELMIIPNPPRFFRQGDVMQFAAKLVNMKEEVLQGEAGIRFFNTITQEDITDQLLDSDQNTQTFSAEPGQSVPVSWEISVPEGIGLISYRVTARSGNVTDGEEKPIPVLSNRMLVTETLPLPVKGSETKSFTWNKLLNAGTAKTLKSHRLVLEFTSNPAWYAVQAIPYLAEQSTESADQIFYRYYANALASTIVESNPAIKNVFEAWKTQSSEALLSNLEKNQELKSVILNETPWVRDAVTESEQKKRIALLFDLNKMKQDQGAALRKLVEKQSPGGGWPWFKGMPDNRHITQQIVTGFGHLEQLGVEDKNNQRTIQSILSRAIGYLDEQMKEDYDWLVERKKANLKENHLSASTIQYLYARSYFLEEEELPDEFQEAYGFYTGQLKQYWTKRGIYEKAMIALTFQKLNETDLAGQVVASLKEYALYSEEMGMYWRGNAGGYYWYQSPIETQAILIEAFAKVTEDMESVEKMKTWLLKQKQTTHWKTSRATAEAVYALLLRGDDWLASTNAAVITLGDVTIDPENMEDIQLEAGTGYFKTSWSGKEVLPEMGRIMLENKNQNIAWGGVYWQYFEDLDNITFAETPLSLKKELFIKQNTESGPVLVPLADRSIQTGDVVIVRVELRVDRDMEYVHMKDMRASAFEPVNVLSGYRYKGGLGYYESTLDASTNFFFDYLRKGTYVFEYPMIASQKGSFSNGITTIQCLYAPEFTSHSEGLRVTIE